MGTSDEYRKFAEECRQQAEKSSRPDDREMWLKLAQQWLRLAADTNGLYRGPRP